MHGTSTGTAPRSGAQRERTTVDGRPTDCVRLHRDRSPADGRHTALSFRASRSDIRQGAVSRRRAGEFTCDGGGASSLISILGRRLGSAARFHSRRRTARPGACSGPTTDSSTRCSAHRTAAKKSRRRPGRAVDAPELHRRAPFQIEDADACALTGLSRRSAPSTHTHPAANRRIFPWNAPESLTRGNGSPGTSTPRNAHSGPHPCPTSYTSSRSGSTAARTDSLCRW